MNSRWLLAGAVATALSAAAIADTVINIPMDQQINLGQGGHVQSPNGDAIYVPSFGNGTLSFEGTVGNGWARQNIFAPSWWYLYVDYQLAGFGNLDASGPGSTLEFEARFYQDFNTNTNPYGDAPIFVRFYTYDDPNGNPAGFRDYSIVYQTGWGCNTPLYPEWVKVTIDLNDMLANYTCGCNPQVVDTGAYNPKKVSRMRFYGTDWSGLAPDSDDYVEFRNMKLTLKPPTCPADLTGDGKIDQADLGALLSNYGASAPPKVLYDSGGFSAYNLGPLPGQDGWSDDTNPDPNYPVTYNPPDVISDPTGGGKGNVVRFDAPDGVEGGWVGAARKALSTNATSRYVLEWWQHRADTGDNLWVADDPSFSEWWAIQWDAAQGNECSTVGFEGLAPLDKNVWQHIKYTLDLKNQKVFLDVGDGKHLRSGCLSGNMAEMRGMCFEFAPTFFAGDGPAYLDDIKLTEIPQKPLGDIDGDGDVDQSDLGALLSVYGGNCP